MKKSKKSQILSEVIKYFIVLIVAVLVVVVGYKAFNLVKEKICKLNYYNLLFLPVFQGHYKLYKIGRIQIYSFEIR